MKYESTNKLRDISYIEKLFYESTKTANGVEISITAYQSLEEVKRNNTNRNMEKKTDCFSFSMG